MVLATGFQLRYGGTELRLDGQALDLGERVAYRGGLMVSGVPNYFHFAGYFKGTYTLRVELHAAFAVRVLAFMAARGFTSVAPCWTGSAADLDPAPPFGLLTAGAPPGRPPGYVQRAHANRPRVGKAKPWRGGWNYHEDCEDLAGARLDDGSLAYGTAGAGRTRP